MENPENPVNPEIPVASDNPVAQEIPVAPENLVAQEIPLAQGLICIYFNGKSLYIFWTEYLYSLYMNTLYFFRNSRKKGWRRKWNGGQ